MAADLRAQFEAAIAHGPHEINASAGAVVFVAGFDVRGAGSSAKAAVDATQEQFIADIGAGEAAARGSEGKAFFCGCDDLQRIAPSFG
jgi:hypothetical protein